MLNRNLGCQNKQWVQKAFPSFMLDFAYICDKQVTSFPYYFSLVFVFARKAYYVNAMLMLCGKQSIS